MRILVAPDSFKGSLEAVDFCRISQQVIAQQLPNAEVICRPMADGGEGTVAAIIEGAGGRYHQCTVKGPLGCPVDAVWGQLNNGVAVIEMAAAAGITLVEKTSLNPLKASTWGVGELIVDALDKGCRQFIIGLGGSATNDGGAGALQALGCRLLDADNKVLIRGGEALSQLVTIDLKGLDQRLSDCEFTIACDVANPLLGGDGATAVFGPQKGADAHDLIILEQALTQFSSLLSQYGKDVVNTPGAGAAGGMAAGMLALLPAKLQPGFDIIREHLHLDDVFKQGLDLVITGEGAFDSQSFAGKLPIALANLAKQHQVPVVVVTGCRGDGYREGREYGVTTVLPLCNKPMSLDQAMSNSEVLLQEVIEELCQILKIATLKAC
ncbi:Glycerate 3-kinase [Sinobacterium norvegicum]|uniref:Glycerate 3-kinase n=1 Tax=Sinobacterium norvegicum TaxID=1641715 RepID=A0ABN8EEE0_9GAMM|nr:glycerate kinase [Sinobacterium norvegicum]CAH0990349.1 Glycerate 3-kinase [Sinobacterium norvegicum]